MAKYYLIDTNVLLVASGHATHIAKAGVEKVSQWLADFDKDDDACLLLDSEGPPNVTLSRIIEEYQNKLSKSSEGWRIVSSKLRAGRYLCYRIEFEGTRLTEVARLPPTMYQGAIDRSDRKFVAVALGHIAKYPRQRCKIVNATDSDWGKCRSVLEQHYVEVLELLA